MKFAYADPPYLGTAKAKYGREEVDHAKLIESMMGLDGWALSASAPSLFQLLPLCPPKTRILSYVKTFATYRPPPAPWVGYAWEPVLFHGGRAGWGKKRWNTRPRDWHMGTAANHGQGDVVGWKDKGFCFWIFECLGIEPGDELWDVFPGNGNVTRLFQAFTGQAVEHPDLPLWSA